MWFRAFALLGRNVLGDGYPGCRSHAFACPGLGARWSFRPFAVRNENINKRLARNNFGFTQRHKETPQRGSSTKPRASDRRERHPGWEDTPDGALKGQKRYE